MGNAIFDFISTRLQPGVVATCESEPFQRLARALKTVETVFKSFAAITGLKPGANEMFCSVRQLS